MKWSWPKWRWPWRHNGGEAQPRRPMAPWLRRLLTGLGVLTLLAGSTVAVTVLWALTILPGSLPPVSALENFQPVIGTKIYDDNDELITELHAERRIFVPLAQIPEALRSAVLATEDRRFYSHWGIDPYQGAVPHP
jgi:penicillin-binding protein 1A